MPAGKEIAPDSTFHWPWETQKPKMLIISLKDSGARRNFMQKQCEALQQPCTFVDAVAGSKLTPAMVDEVAHHCKMRLSRNEVGCFLSHKACWQKTVSDGLSYAIIVEDDVTVDQDIQNLRARYIPQLEVLDPEWDVLYLAFNHDIDFKSHFAMLKAKNALPPETPPLIRANLDNVQYWTDQNTMCVRRKPPMHIQ